jgi:hypothetical protein
LKLTRSLIFALTAVALVLPACSSLTLEHVNYSWPVESPLTVTSSNTVDDVRYGLAFPIGGVAAAEFGDSTALRGTVIRVIRNAEGYYFLTGPRFKHVYVFAPGGGTLVQHAALEVSTTGLTSPALNQRPPYIELLDGDRTSRRLTSSEIVEEKK